MDKSLDEIIQENKQSGDYKTGKRRLNHNRPPYRDNSSIHNHSHSNITKRSSHYYYKKKNWVSQREKGWKTVKITNVFYGLNEEDLKGLFSQVGKVRFVKIQYDQSGRSEGVAWVAYFRPTDAQEAVERFNDKMAAGQQIQLRLTPQVPSNRDADKAQDIRGRFHPKGLNSSSSGSRKPTTKRNKPTLEELDAQLLDYMGTDNGKSADASETTTTTTGTNENNEIVTEDDIEMK